MVTGHRGHVDGPWGRIPITVEAPRGRGPGVLLLHGLGSDRGAHRKEMDALQARGLVAAAIDAPDHGERQGPLVDEIRQAHGPASRVPLFRLVRRAAEELPAVVRHLREHHVTELGAVGISMGAYTLLAALPGLRDVTGAVSLLGSPAWLPEGPVPDALRALAEHAPERHADRYVDARLLMVNGGLDVNVPAGPSRAFHARLLELGARQVDYVEYPHSTHFMRAADWEDAWERSVRFLGWA